MKVNDSRRMAIVPVILFIGIFLTVFFAGGFLRHRVALYAALLPFILTVGTAVYAAAMLIRRNRTEVMFSREDLKNRRIIGVICAIIAASLWVMYAGSFTDGDLDRLKKLSQGLCIGAAVYLASIAVCSAALFIREALQMQAKKTAAFMIAVLAALAGGGGLGCFLVPVVFRAVIIDEEAFLTDITAVKQDMFVEFGSWPQDGPEPEPIVWRVLGNDGSVLTLMSEYALDASYYYFDTCEYFKYRESAVRAFVSGEFLAGAFTEEERARLLPQSVGGAEEDLVVIPTLTQAMQTFGIYAKCPATENVKEKIPVSKAGDSSFFVRPDDPETTDVYLYCLMPIATKHTIRVRDAYDVDEHGVRPVIQIRAEE